MSLSTRRANCMNVDLRAPLNLPVCLLALAFRRRKGGTSVRPSWWPSSRRRRRSPSTVACRAVARSITRSPSWCTTPTAIRGAGVRLRRGSAEEVDRAAVVQRLDRPRLEQRARARMGGVRGEDLQWASHVCWLESGPAERSRKWGTAAHKMRAYFPATWTDTASAKPALAAASFIAETSMSSTPVP